jgi:signal transduction histidine kinase
LKRKNNNKNITNYNFSIIDKKYYLYLGFIFFLTIFTIVIVVFLYGKFNTDLDYVNSYLVLLTILVILISVLSIALTNSILKDMSQKHRNEIELQHIKMENIYFSDVNKALEEIRIIRHDMRGELAIIHGYNELNQKDKIRNHIEKKLKEMDVQLVPQIDEDSIITSFLNFKVNEAQIKGINVEIHSNIHEDSKIVVDKEDLCRIINNIMNNAIEANNQCEEKYIKIEFIVEDDYIYIGSENPFYGNVLKKGNTILTKKSDKTRHGYGLKSIKAIAEKYNGHISADHDDNVFYVEVDVLNKLLI